MELNQTQCLKSLQKGSCSFLEDKGRDVREVIGRLECNSEKWNKTILGKIIQIINSNIRNLQTSCADIELLDKGAGFEIWNKAAQMVRRILSSTVDTCIME